MKMKINRQFFLEQTLNRKTKTKLEIIILLATVWFLITLPLPVLINNPDVNEEQFFIILPIIGLMSVPFIVLAIVWSLKPELANQ